MINQTTVEIVTPPPPPPLYCVLFIVNAGVGLSGSRDTVNGHRPVLDIQKLGVRCLGIDGW